MRLVAYAVVHSRLSDEIVDEISGVPGRVLAAVAYSCPSDEIINEISSVPRRVLAAVAYSCLSDEIIDEISSVPGHVLAAVTHIITFCRICRRNVIYIVSASENQVPDGAGTVLRP
jgi:hypothetical protein